VGWGYGGGVGQRSKSSFISPCIRCRRLNPFSSPLYPLIAGSFCCRLPTAVYHQPWLNCTLGARALITFARTVNIYNLCAYIPCRCSWGTHI
jgi:hypothetical protein